MQAERVGPEWTGVRHGELLAALHNGALQKNDKSLFSPAEFMPADPWDSTPRPKFLNPAEASLAGLFEGAIDE